MSETVYTQEETLAAGLYLLELIRAALQESKAPEKPEDVVWEAVYDLAKRHSVEGLSAFGAETLEEKPPHGIWEKWQKKPLLGTLRGVHFDVERKRIFARMKEAGFSYLPLKGVHIVNYYPKPGMRVMVDNDILFGYVEPDEGGGYRLRGATEAEQKSTIEEASDKLLQLMTEDGYDGKLGMNHDAYVKKPFYRYEMHRRLFSQTNPFYDYYKNPWKRAIQDAQDPNCYHFSDEDEFIYVLVHAHKHFSNGGCGIRLFADLHVFQEKKGNTMDWDYVNREMKAMGIDGFANRMMSVAQAVFGKAPRALTQDEKELLLFMLTSGMYGTLNNSVWNSMENMATEGKKVSFRHRIRYAWERAFPEEKWWEGYHPIAYKKKYLRPFVTLRRIIKGALRSRQRLWKEWLAMWKKSR